VCTSSLLSDELVMVFVRLSLSDSIGARAVVDLVEGAGSMGIPAPGVQSPLGGSGCRREAGGSGDVALVMGRWMYFHESRQSYYLTKGEGRGGMLSALGLMELLRVACEGDQRLSSVILSREHMGASSSRGRGADKLLWSLATMEGKPLPQCLLSAVIRSAKNLRDQGRTWGGGGGGGTVGNGFRVPQGMQDRCYGSEGSTGSSYDSSEDEGTETSDEEGFDTPLYTHGGDGVGNLHASPPGPCSGRVRTGLAGRVMRSSSNPGMADSAMAGG
ncbi:unnamed protein product, partial [Discosporangium mesarthrocarpum]